jgi:transposase
MAAQTILVIESGDSIRRVAQHLHTSYETVRQAVNRPEDAGYVTLTTVYLTRSLNYAAVRCISDRLV